MRPSSGCDSASFQSRTRLGEAASFCVSAEGPGLFPAEGHARKYFSPNVFGGLVKIRDKLSLKIRDKRGGNRLDIMGTGFLKVVPATETATVL